MREFYWFAMGAILFILAFAGLQMFLVYDNCRDYAAMGYKVHRGNFTCYVKFDYEWKRV